MRRLLDAFGPDGLRVELQRPFQRHDRALNRGLASLAARLGVPCVATGNVHAHTRERAMLQDAFVAIRKHTTLDASEPLRRGNFSHVLASPAAMAARFEDHPDAVKETLRARRNGCASTSPATSATAIRAPRTARPTASWPSCAGRRSTGATRWATAAGTRRRVAWRRSCG